MTIYSQKYFPVNFIDNINFNDSLIKINKIKFMSVRCKSDNKIISNEKLTFNNKGLLIKREIFDCNFTLKNYDYSFEYDSMKNIISESVIILKDTSQINIKNLYNDFLLSKSINTTLNDTICYTYKDNRLIIATLMKKRKYVDNIFSHDPYSNKFATSSYCKYYKYINDTIKVVDSCNIDNKKATTYIIKNRKIIKEINVLDDNHKRITMFYYKNNLLRKVKVYSIIYNKESLMHYYYNW